MKLVCTMLVGNEEDLVSPAIETALSQGVDAFVIVETASRDGTADALRRYVGDPRFDITFLQPETVYGDAAPHPYDVWEEMVERARTRFGADWVVRIDADEFIMAPNGGLKALCAAAQTDEVHLIRVNALLPSDGSDLATIVGDADQLAAIDVVARPFPNDLVRSGDCDDLPLILTHVAQRAMSRANRLLRFDAGGHVGVDADEAPFSHCVATDAWIVHLWFTSENRFQSKAQFLSDIAGSVRGKTPGGWQWNRWADQATAMGGIADEFRRQMLDETVRATLVRQGRVARADAVDPSMVHVHDGRAVARDLEALGYATPVTDTTD